ncbi:MAG: hypothetical protein JSW43_02740 [Gemmatimonadota bacterium]|nr:MAG: hypothetical protein JSW43_02740 [Gemmatimonadota bacterium]
MTSKPRNRLLQTAGWLLTPVVVWAAAFLGGWLGAFVVRLRQVGDAGLAWMLVGGVLGGTVGVVVWVVVLRRLGRPWESASAPSGEERGSPPA